MMLMVLVALAVAQGSANRFEEHAAFRALPGARLPHLWVHGTGVLGGAGTYGLFAMCVLLMPSMVMMVLMTGTVLTLRRVISLHCSFLRSSR